MRRSEDGQYIIDKVMLDGADANGAQRHKYALWQYVRTHWSFDTAQEAIDEATSLQDQAAAAWAKLKAAQAEADVATPASASLGSSPE